MPSPTTNFDAIRNIRDFASLIKYLRTDLGWPVDEEHVEDLTFNYRAAELGLDETAAVKIREIKQLRPLTGIQPWGIFWIDFEPKALPVLVLRRILNALVRKQRGEIANRATWELHDLLFISATGAGSQRGISFAHFERDGDADQLRTFSWDVRETHLYYIEKFKLDKLKWPQNPADAQSWRAQWSAAFSVEHRYVVRTAQQLAGEMARIAGEIREAVGELYTAENVGGPLHQLHLSLKMTLITDLNEADFADMYAQTVTYGLFAARATRQGEFAGGGVEALIEHTTPFLRELLGQLMAQKEMDFDGLGVNELIELLRQVNMEEILMDFGRQKRGEDPVIHFYETFMKQYDPVQKTRRGEFYTPDAVVSFIVRSVDHLLRTEFGCADGLLSMTGTDDFAPVILDPATGTGTFLKYVIGEMYNNFVTKHKSRGKAETQRLWQEYVPAQLLPRLYGFELKMSPYTIAHLKLGLALQETGYELKDDERLRIYLSNALQPAHEVARVDTPALAHEVEQANEAKAHAPITIVMGNPPYAGHSSNASRDHQGDHNFIGNLLQDYYKLDGKPLGEKNPKWLQDDYVKFLRFAQWRIKQSGAGIVAMITNHGYLDNPTFRGMRQQLMQTFDEIYVLNLHGNIMQKETASDGSKDENVFDIQQGVAICFMVKHSGTKEKTKVSYADLYGLREHKYEWLLTHHKDISSVDWQGVDYKEPFYLFIPQNSDTRDEYHSTWGLTDIFPVNNIAMQTHRDYFVIDLDINTLKNRIIEFRGQELDDVSIAEKYELGNLDIKKARQKIRADKNWENSFTKCLWRPFDIQNLYYSKELIDRPRAQVTDPLLKPNYALLAMRQIALQQGCSHFLVTKTPPIDRVFYSNKGAASVFPLYIYSDELAMFAGQLGLNRKPNFADKFVSEFGKSISLRFTSDGTGDPTSTFGPEDVFHYMYAVFHSPSYRSRYAEFLKIDFPRLPLTGNLDLFRQLCGLGKELVALHLLEGHSVDENSIERSGVRFIGSMPSAPVAAGYPMFEIDTVYINPSQGFQGVSTDVWEFHVGGYQVCQKWLKDRRGRQLSAEDILHYRKIVVALGETVRLMGAVDVAIESAGGWPMQ